MFFGSNNKLSSLLNRLKIRYKLLSLYIFSFFVPFVVLSVILSLWLHDTLQKWQLEQSRSSVVQTATLFKDVLNTTEDLSNTLYVNRQIQSTLRREYASSQEVYDQYITISFMDDFLHANSEVSSIRFYTENPTILDNAYFIKTTSAIGRQDWYRYAKELKGRSFWVMKVDSITRRKMLSLVRSVWDSQDGAFIGVLSINIDYDRINRFLISQEKETFIAVDDLVEFASSQLPENRSPEFLREKFSGNSVEILETKWEGSNVFALVSLLYGNQDNSIVLVQIIPTRTIFVKTLQGTLIFIVIMVLALALSLLLIFVFSGYFDSRVAYVNSEIQKVVKNNFEIGPSLEGTDELAEIYSALEVMTDNTKKLIQEVYQHELEQEKLLSRQNDIRFKMLASQINPHFLFNTLETIRMQAFADGNKNVANTIKLLAKILRHNLAVTDRPVPVMEELEAISNYLDIQHLRFADRVSYDIIYLCDVRNYGILPLLIQPVVENSFIHGLEARNKGGFIYITIESDGTRNLYIRVKDNGCGMNSTTLEGLKKKLLTGTVENINSSIGMVNVNQRIKLFYGQEYGIDIESEENKGTEVTIHVPLVPITGIGEE